MTDGIKEVKELINKYGVVGFIYVKPLDYLLPRIKSTKKEIEKEILSCENLEFVESQHKSGETRYALFFIYNNRRGKVYVITFGDKIKIITAFPLGKKTLRKYKKKRFIKSQTIH
ncbi:hypothetical protein HYT25_04900 [Candidatus Pacearchaeota archaeon]|nr:hypothetical protein [Candidatus Pacearchaeota archaeon]